MGIGGISIWQLAIILVIVLLLFGTKKLRGLGGDLGGAIKGFKKAMSDEDKGENKDAETGKVENQSADSEHAESETSENKEKTEAK